MKNKFFLFLLLVILLGSGFATGFFFPYKNKTGAGKNGYAVKSDNSEDSVPSRKAKNIIFMVGDGMGLTQIYAGMTANKGHMNFERFKNIGFSKTYSSSSYITDSAAGATAFSIGKKTFNGAIGLDKDSVAVKTILEMAEENGLATGLVSTSAITHATPASFIAHNVTRDDEAGIALDFLKTDVDVFIGGGQSFFNLREDSLNLFDDLRKNGYEVATTIDEVAKSNSKKLAGLLAEDGMPKAGERGDMLAVSAKKAIDILKTNEKGFFLMIEGSQIDWAGHANDPQWLIDEMLDFDKVMGEVLDFVKADGNTLLVITADHETGGLTLNGGDLEKGTIDAKYTTGYHTAVMVPVFAYGPSSANFRGIYENTAIFQKFLDAYQMKNTQ
ncbi:MAG: alkaline phosphatase [Arenicella sp.]|jgi:alkaline phosphatase